MLCTLLVVGVISHLWCAARLVGIAHHSFYSVLCTTLTGKLKLELILRYILRKVDRIYLKINSNFNLLVSVVQSKL